MRKTDKKIDNQIRLALTEVCETALKEFEGFQWLTHLVNYSSFPKSLKVVCVFDTNESLSNYMASNNGHVLSTLIQKKLFEIGVGINDMAKHIHYETEESCENKDNGNWTDRLSKVGHQLS